MLGDLALGNPLAGLQLADIGVGQAGKAEGHYRSLLLMLLVATQGCS